MAKRYRATDCWKKPFIKNLPAEYKLLWFYILDDCDHAGIWQVDIDGAQLRIGEKITAEKAVLFFKDKVKVIDAGEKWFIQDFIDFQYGELKENNKVHQSVIQLLKKNKIEFEGLPRGYQDPKEKDTDKEKEKVKDKEKEKPSVVEIFPSEILTKDELYNEHLARESRMLSVDLQTCLNNWDGWYCSKFTGWRGDYEAGKLTLAALRKAFESWLTDPKSRSPVLKTNGTAKKFTMEELRQ